MNEFTRILTAAVLLMMFSTPEIFTMGGKVEKIPMRPYEVINIPDGEFLRYGLYTGDEKTGDTYYVSRLTANVNGGKLFKIYSCNIKVSDTGKPLENYTNWPSFFLIDPVKGSILEMEQTYDTNSSIYKNSTENYPFYFLYQYFPEKGYVDEIIKFIKGKTITQSKYRVKVNPDFPSWDQLSYSFFSPRFMNAGKGGIAYMIAPFIIKDPAPFTFYYGPAETVKTKAGTFRANRLNLVLADPFIKKLTDAFTEDMSTWVEDSDRRLLIKSLFLGNLTILEEISNINY